LAALELRLERFVLLELAEWCLVSGVASACVWNWLSPLQILARPSGVLLDVYTFCKDSFCHSQDSPGRSGGFALSFAL
jgi:hypothetical protein